jgi:hypothetical protein
MLALASCQRGGGGAGPAATTTTPVTAAPGGDDQAVDVTTPSHPKGGSARVAVWSEPDPAAPTLGGAAVRALVLPQLFTARPDGRWSPSLVKPGTDKTADDRQSATFALRDGAVWSDGTPITIEDLRRSADQRFVAAVEDAGSGTIRVRFTQPLPGWRRLWSAADSISPPGPGVFGGPFVVSSRTAGLETVLTRNERWWGRAAFLDEVHLVLVPDSTTARQLLAKAELDVVGPLAGTVRTSQLRGVADVKVSSTKAGGWNVVLLANESKLGGDQRKAVFATVERARFVTVLLAGEATLLHGFAGPEDATWRAVDAGDAGALKGRTVDLVGMVEEPMTVLLNRSMQKRARAAGGSYELRQSEADRVEGWLARGEYQAAITPIYDPPGNCWRCRWEGVDAGLATRADAGDASAAAELEARLRDESRVLPLWHQDTVVATRAPLNGPAPNGYALSAAWNAPDWWLPSPR